jgi:tetratricopeptide (TPR) repeat protein
MLALALALASPDGGDAQKLLSIPNAASLVEKDWWDFEVGTAPRRLPGGQALPWTVTTSRLRIISLLPRTRWGSGAAWLIEFTGTDEEGGTYRAFQGQYDFSAEKIDQGTLLLSLRFPRMYSAAAQTGRLDWKLGIFNAPEPTGVTIEIPLEGRSVPANEVRYVIPEAFFVDDEGNPNPKTFGPISLSRQKKVYSTEFVEIGEVLCLTDRPLKERPQAALIAGRLLIDPPPGYRLREAGPTPIELAEAAFGRGEYDLAIALFSRALAAHPKDARAYRGRAQSRAKRGDIVRAIADYAEALRIEPSHAELHRERGDLHRQQGQFREAIGDYGATIDSDSSDVSARNALAWLLATCPQDDLRNGRRAYELAKLNCEATNLVEPVYLDTLAAAYAELQDFPHAIEFQSRALSLASSPEKEDYRPRLELYRQRRPYRETPPATVTSPVAKIAATGSNP